jgi:hypothetical protein
MASTAARRAAEFQRDRFHGNAERLADDHQDRGARAGAEVLRGHFHLDGAVGVDGQVAVAFVPAPAPSVDGESQAALDRPLRFIAARMPALLPAHQLVGDGQLVAILLGALRQVEVAQDQVIRILVEFGG